MTQQKHRKQRVRAWMARTGERYAAAYCQVTGNTHQTNNATRLDHLPGQIPAANALRNLLWRAGVQARVRALYEREVAALGQLGAVVADLDAPTRR